MSVPSIPYDSSENFVYTGTTDFWVKPAGIDSAYFIIKGGGGGGSTSYKGGNGAYIYANFKNLQVDISYNVTINVGGGGKAPPDLSGGISVGGYIDPSFVTYSNGGRGTTLNNVAYSGGGGGMSSVFYKDPYGNVSIKNIAGGGGGGGTIFGSNGGNSGGVGYPLNNQSESSSIGFYGGGIGGGEPGNTSLYGDAGLGGIVGGVNGYNYYDISATSFFNGGGGGSGGTFAGGGGGAGYGGAAGGKKGGGGGGGSYTNANISTFTTNGGLGGMAGQNGENGSILVLWNNTPNYPLPVVSQFMLNAQHTGKSIYNAPYLSPADSLSYSTISQLNPNSGVITSDRELYIVSGDGSLYAFNHDFTFRWRFVFDGDFKCIGTPAIVPNGTLYISAVTSTSLYYFFALSDNTTQGGQKWKFPIDSNPSTSPMVDSDGYIYFGTENGTLYALKDNNVGGILGWKYPTIAPNIPIIGTPTFDISYNKLAYTTNNTTTNTSSIYLLDISTNSVENNIDPTLRWNKSVTNDVYTTPSVGFINDEYIVNISTINGHIYVYDISNGNQKFTLDVADISLSSAVIDNNNFIYFTSKNYFNVIDGSNGALEWKFPIDISGITPSVSNNSIPTIDASNNVYFGARNRYLYSLNGQQRKFNWRYGVGEAIQSMPVISNNGDIFFGANDGKIYDLSGNSTATPQLTPIVQMYMLDSKHSGQSPYNGPTTAPMVNQIPFVSGNLFVSPSISISNDGIIYLGSNDGYVYAWDSYTGVEQWRVSNITNSNISSPNSMYTTPAIGLDGTIYIGSNAGYLYALNPANGSLKWSYYAGGPLQSSPMIDSNGFIYFGAGTKMFAIGDGQYKAYSKWIDPYDTGDNVNSSPALGTNGYLYFGSNNGYVYALNSFTGFKIWDVSLNIPSGVHPIYTSAAVDNSDNVIIGNGSYMDGTLYCLNGLTGGILWQKTYDDPNNGPFYNTPAIKDDTIYFSTIPYVYAINRTTGDFTFRFKSENCYYTSPIVDPSGSIYVASLQARDTIYDTGFKKNDGILHCLSPVDLSVIWQIKVCENGRLAPPVIDNNGIIYTSSTANAIYAIS